MSLTVALICLEFDQAALKTIAEIPDNIDIIIKSVKKNHYYEKQVKQKSNITVKVQPDISIYDAMNQALNYVKTDYVIFIGVNDIISSVAAERVSAILSDKFDAYIFGVKIGSRITKIEKFGSILCFHHQGTIMKTHLYRKYGGFVNYEIHADLALLNEIASKHTSFRYKELGGEYVVDYDLGGTSNSGANAFRSIKELYSIFKKYENNYWTVSHIKVFMRPLYYWMKSFVS